MRPACALGTARAPGPCREVASTRRGEDFEVKIFLHNSWRSWGGGSTLGNKFWERMNVVPEIFCYCSYGCLLPPKALISLRSITRLLRNPFHHALSKARVGGTVPAIKGLESNEGSLQKREAKRCFAGPDRSPVGPCMWGVCWHPVHIVMLSSSLFDATPFHFSLLQSHVSVLCCQAPAAVFPAASPWSLPVSLLALT